jgi:hypothetical protein
MIPGHARPALGLNDDNRRFDTIVMGRTTYDIGRAVGLTSPYPHLRQIVVSTSAAASPDPAVEVVGQDLTSSHGLKPCDSRFTLPLPQRGHQRRSAGLRPTGSDGSPRTRQAAPAGLAG